MTKEQLRAKHDEIFKSGSTIPFVDKHTQVSIQFAISVLEEILSKLDCDLDSTACLEINQKIDELKEQL